MGSSGKAFFGAQKATAQAGSDRAQAEILELESKEVLRATRREADIFGREGEVAFGNQVSSFAKAGVDLSGSPLLVLAQTKADLINEQEDIKRRGAVEAKLIRAGASNLRSQATRTQKAGRQGFQVAAISSIFGAGSS